MMIWEQVLEDLKGRVPIEQIRKKYRSQSQQVRAFRVYLDELNKEIPKIREALIKEKIDLDEKKDRCDQLRKEEKERTIKVDNLKKQEIKLFSTVKDLSEKVAGFQRDTKAFEKKGFSSEIVYAIKNSRIKNGTAILEFLLNQKNSLELQKEIQQLKEKKKELDICVISLKRDKIKTKKILRSEKNHIDLIRAEKASFQKIISVVELCFKRGYTHAQIVSLFVGLERMEIQKQPTASIEYFLEAIAKAKNLLNLTQKTNLAKKRLAKIKKEIAELEDTFQFNKEIVLKVIKSETEKSKQTIETVGDNLIKEADKIVAYLTSQIDHALINVKRSAIEAEKVEQARKFIDPLLSLIGIDTKSENWNKVPNHLVVRLLCNLQTWLDLKYPGVNEKIQINAVKGELELSPFGPISPKISSLLKVVAECIKKYEVEETKKDSKRVE